MTRDEQASRDGALVEEKQEEPKEEQARGHLCVTERSKTIM